MTKNIVNETERMLSQEFLMPTELGLEGVDRPEIHYAVVGTEGLYCARLRDGFRVGGKFLCCMKSPDGQEFGMR